MLSKDFLLSLLAVILTCVIVDGTLTNTLVLSRDAVTRGQAVLNSVDDPSVPVLKTMKSGGIFRSYRISIPNDYDPKSPKKWPLIVDFHGRNGNSEGQWNNSQYYLNPSGKEFIVVYPLGCFGAGNHGGPPERAWQGAPYANKSCNDLLFVSDLVNRTQTNYNINSTRIYASGKSNGGGFVDTLACSSTGDLFAAFAMASAALYTDELIGPDSCAGKRPRMILESHGSEDDTIPINGRNSQKKDYSTPNIASWTTRWAQRNGCNAGVNPDITEETWGINKTYTCKGLNNVVQQYNVTGLGHCWPSLTDNTDFLKHGGNICVQTLDFTQAVMDFFAAWEKAT